MVSRGADRFTGRMVNTEVRVYSTEGGEIEVASCGKITGKNSILYLKYSTDTICFPV